MSIASQGLKMDERCSDCGATVATEVVQRLIHGSLQWSASRSCRTCGLQEELDCDKDGMERMRQLLLEDCAYNLETEAPKSAIMAAIRSVTTVSLQEAGKQAASILDGRWRGTFPEATLLAHALADRDQVSEVRSVAS